MCLLLITVCCFLSGPSIANNGDLNGIRTQFHQAALNADIIPYFYQQISRYQDDDPIILAYKAASEALIAQKTWNPVEKYQQLKRFESLMDQAISKAPENIEIRFIRFSVQYYIPKVLGFSEQLHEDKMFISENIEKIRDLNLDPGFTHYIVYFIKETGLYDFHQVSLIESKLSVR